MNKYYICEECGELTTEKELINDCSDGGQGMCYCRFLYRYWDRDIDLDDVLTDRIFIPYTEIRKEHYDWLSSEYNDVTRLRMFKTIDRMLLLKNNDREN